MSVNFCKKCNRVIYSDEDICVLCRHDSDDVPDLRPAGLWQMIKDVVIEPYREWIRGK